MTDLALEEARAYLTLRGFKHATERNPTGGFVVLITGGKLSDVDWDTLDEIMRRDRDSGRS